MEDKTCRCDGLTASATLVAEKLKKRIVCRHGKTDSAPFVSFERSSAHKRFGQCNRRKGKATQTFSSLPRNIFEISLSVRPSVPVRLPATLSRQQGDSCFQRCNIVQSQHIKVSSLLHSWDNIYPGGKPGIQRAEWKSGPTVLLKACRVAKEPYWQTHKDF